MTMLIHQFHFGSPRRMSKMYSKVIVFAIVLAVASCQEHSYVYKPRHEPSKEYKRYEHIPLKVYPTAPPEPAPISEEEYEESIPLEKEHQENHGQPFLSQSIIHHTGQHETQDNSEEKVAPVYQYVSEHNEEANVYSTTPPKFHTVRYTAPAPVHLDIPSIKLPEQPRPKPHYVPEEFVYHATAEAAHGHHPEIHSYESHDEPIDYYAYPKYQFEYKVEDTHTGDNKYQHEIRDGDVVKGVYGLHESDGSIRTVEYSSDKHSGFTAIVKHSTPNQHVEIATHHKN